MHKIDYVHEIDQDASVPNLASPSKAHLTSRGWELERKRKVELCVSEQRSFGFEGR